MINPSNLPNSMDEGWILSSNPARESCAPMTPVGDESSQSFGRWGSYVFVPFSNSAILDVSIRSGSRKRPGKCQ
jgi:hypothetical protein